MRTYKYKLCINCIPQWNLICDMDWVKSAVTSVQMCGVLLGALLAGQMGDLFGRKKTLYVFVLEHAVLNFVAAFSVSWQMFAACRFFIGVGIGKLTVFGGMNFKSPPPPPHQE